MSENAFEQDRDPCCCGCGRCPRLRQSIWCQGHDQKFKCEMLRRIDQGDREALDRLLEHPTLVDPSIARERFEVARRSRAAGLVPIGKGRWGFPHVPEAA